MAESLTTFPFEIQRVRYSYSSPGQEVYRTVLDLASRSMWIQLLAVPQPRTKA